MTNSSPTLNGSHRLNSRPTLNIPHDLLNIAIEWQVTLWSGEVTAKERSEFERWLHASAEHQSAWQQVQQVNQQLGDLPNPIANRVLRQTAAVNHQRRQLLRSLVGITSLGVLGFGASRTPQWHSATADYRTARGEFRNLTLADGTQLMLNTASAVDVQFTAEARRVILHRGEVQLITGADAGSAGARPFSVETTAGTLRPIGTQFTLRQLDQNVQVQVTEGAVELYPTQGHIVRVNAGQQTQFNRKGAAAAQVADNANIAWTRGLLIAEQQPLGDFIANLSRYHSGVLRCDPAVANLMVSGVYPLKDTQAILRALAHALPIRVNLLMGYWTSISAR